MATSTTTTTTTTLEETPALTLLDESKCFGGIVRRYQHSSVKCQCDMKFHIFLPPTDEKDEQEKIPVLWVLSGLTCDDTNFILKAGAQRVAAANGIALICPDTSPRNVSLSNLSEEEKKLLDEGRAGPGASYYMNATTPNFKTHYNMFDYITDELPKLIIASFPQLDAKAQSIMGHSMGGHGALVAFFSENKMIDYRSVSAFAPVCNPSASGSWHTPVLSLYLGTDQQEWAKYDASTLISNYKGPKVQVLVDQGRADTKKDKLNPKALEKAANGNPNVILTINYREGYDHGYYFVSSFIESHIQHHSKKLKSFLRTAKSIKSAKRKIKNVVRAVNVIKKANRWIFHGADQVKENFEAEYTQGRQLGQPGQYGVAYECTKKSDHTQYAVKIIAKARFIEGCRKEDRKCYYQQFKDEINIMKQLDHKNLIKLYDVFEDQTKLYLVMEKCSGGELFDRIQIKGKYSEQDAAKVLRDLAEGIEAMHNQKIAHCDLKPDNCLFVTKDQDSSLKIIDFGMSKFSPKTNITGFRGTPYYVAPEIISSTVSQKKYTFHCDMWSFGVITFVMLFGFPPFFSRENDDNQIFKKINEGFNPVTKKGYGPWFPKNRQVSQAAKDFIANCLKIDILKRYTATEALQDPWLTGKTASKEPLLDNVMSALTEFTANCKFKAAVLMTMTDVLTEQEIAQLKKTFESIDKNGDGTITAQELKESVETSLGPSMTQEKKNELESLQKLIENADVDGDGMLSYEELLATAINRKMKLKEERMWKAFCRFDEDGDGKISVEELQNALSKQHSEGDVDITEIFNRVDENGDGFVDFSEFMGMWRQKANDHMTSIMGQK